MAKFDLTNQIFSVSEYLDLINELLVGAKIIVQGEVTELKLGSQWVGFTLKDKEDGSLLKCVLGGWQYKKIGVPLENGMEVKVTGVSKISKKWGSFSFWVDGIEPLGEGSLKKAYELLLKQLKTEGLYDRKRPIPEFIERIAVISSRNGVVIHDLRQNLRELGFMIDFYHSQMEGAKAVTDIIKAIEMSDSSVKKYDALIIIRGGGSLESLQAFNNEAVCKAIFSSKIPVIVGIGHEVDVPIACLVADTSASTPTGVAHIINSTWDALFEGLPRLERQIDHSFSKMLERLQFGVALRLNTIQNYFERIFNRFDRLEQILQNAHSAISRAILNINNRVLGIEQLLATVSPERNLKLGYSIVFNHSGRVLKHVKDVKIGEQITTRLSDGVLESEVIKN